MYMLQEGRSTEIDILQTSKERSRTFWGRGSMQQSDRHSSDIKRDHVQSAGGENAAVRSTFCRHQKRDHILSAGEKNAAVRSTFWRHQTRSRTFWRSARTQQSEPHSAEIKREITYGLQEGDNAAVRSKFCRHNGRSRTFLES